jgi:hypothetical protein
MTSDSRREKGFILPEQIDGHDLICVTLKIPDVPEYRAAFRGALKMLEEWWNWEKGGNRGSQAANYWRYLIYTYLKFADCDELDILGGCDMGDLQFCWFTDDNGDRILRWSTNGGCTWNEVEECDDSAGGGVITVPIDPIDRPGEYPDPDYHELTKCRVVDITWRRLYEYDFSTMVANVLTATSATLSTALLNWMAGSLIPIENYEKLKEYVVKHLPHYVSISTMWDSAMYPEEIKCLAHGCTPDTGSITTEVRACLADAIDNLDGSSYFFGEDGSRLREALYDFTRIFPIEVLRRWAVIDAGNTTTVVTCDDCDGEPPLPGDCPDRVVTFEIPAEYVINVGAEGLGKDGFGVKSVTVMSGTFQNMTGSWQAAVGSRVTIPMGDDCTLKGVYFTQKTRIENPQPNANAVVKVWMNVKAYLDSALVHQSGAYNNSYYFSLATTWSRFGRIFNVPFVCDTIELEWFIGSDAPDRQLTQTVDNIELIFETPE